MWSRIAHIAPRLDIADRATFLSILWGRHETYTDILSPAAGRLEATLLRRRVFCAMESLVPSVDGILNVSTLNGLLAPDAATLQVNTASGTPIALPRPIITALAMELRIVCRDEPRPFFVHLTSTICALPV